MRTKTTYYAVANGKPLALGLQGIFGLRRGVLCKPVQDIKDAALFIGFNSKKCMMRIINRTIKAQQTLRSSVIYDWLAAKDLTELGVISVVKMK